MAAGSQLRGVWIALLGVVTALTGVAAGSPEAAASLMQRPGITGCITETGSSGECQDGRGLVGTASIALSPDNRNAYVASSAWNTVAVLALDPADGGLSPENDTAGCLDSREVPYPDCTPARQLGGADDVAVSPDGASVYVAASSDNAVVVFDRDPETGTLSQSAGTDGCLNAEGSDGCTPARGLDVPRALVISPDGENVYVASSGPSGGIAVFNRSPATGDLSQEAGTAGCLNPTGADGCATSRSQLLDARGIAISPDGETVYAASRAPSAVTVYTRDSSGALSPKAGTAGCIDEDGANNCQDGTGMIEPLGVSVSPDERNVYVAASRSDAVAIFDRDATTGDLTQKPGTAGCVSNTGASDPAQPGSTAGQCQDGLAMDGVNSVAVSPDGGSLYATVAHSAGVVVFRRDSDGSLSQLPGAEGCITEGGYEDPTLPWTEGSCEKGRALLGAKRVITSGDGRHAYAAASEGGIAVFDVASQPPADLGGGGQSLPVALDSGAACSKARAVLRRARRGVRSAKRVLRRETRNASRAGSRAARVRHAAAVHRARQKLRKRQRSNKRVLREKLRACS